MNRTTLVLSSILLAGLLQPVRAATVLSLGDINGDASQDVAVLSATQGVATVKDVVTGRLLQRVAFSGSVVPDRFMSVPDTNDNGAPELLVQISASSYIELRDSLSGQLLIVSNVFPPAYEYVDSALVPDQDGNGVAEVALLGRDGTTGRVRVETRDARSWEFIATARFPAGCFANHLLTLPDVNGDALPDVAVLCSSSSSTRVEIRTLNGALVRRIALDKTFDYLQTVLVPDTGGHPELALLRSKPSVKLEQVLTIDAQTGATLQRIPFSSRFAPLKLAVMPDLTGNGRAELALLEQNVDTGANKVQLRDAVTGALVKNIWFDKVHVPQDVAVFPDSNGNGVAEVGVLGLGKSDGAQRLFVTDAGTQMQISVIEFGTRGMVAMVSAGGGHTCGLKTDGSVGCWGWNYYGQANPPVGSFSQISAGSDNTCGVKTDGRVACWGVNDVGQSTPPAGTFSQVSAGPGYTCGVKTDRSITCWGNDYSGRATPPAGSFSQVSTGWEHACGVKTDNSVVCWGSNRYGQSTPPAGSFSQVAAGFGHTCGLKIDGNVACWGRNQEGESTAPAGTFSQVSAPSDHTCGLKIDGSVSCWGNGHYGQSTPPAGSFSQVSAGYRHSCGVKIDGNVVCWGDNYFGQSTPPPGW